MRSAIATILILVAAIFAANNGTFAQSSDQNFPTRVTSNEINGTITARDIGDARLTTYFYVFGGEQGDIFINVATKNFSGDIDVFTVDSLKPLTKMVMFADSDLSETGRLVYLREPQRLMLRIEGRSPNDDPATFRIKFAGSFVALAPERTQQAPTLERADDRTPGVKVNSVGTIVAVIPKPSPVKATEKTRETKEEKVPDEEKQAEPTEKKADSIADNETVYENKSAKVTVKSASKPKAATRTPAKSKANTAKPPAKTKDLAKPAEEPQPDPLATIHLVIVFKDGKTIEKPMNEVLRFSVDRGMLTVIAKDGTIARYSILDVARVTID